MPERATGLERTILHATNEGFPVCRRMSCRPIVKFPFYGRWKGMEYEQDICTDSRNMDGGGLGKTSFVIFAGGVISRTHQHSPVMAAVRCLGESHTTIVSIPWSLAFGTAIWKMSSWSLPGGIGPPIKPA